MTEDHAPDPAHGQSLSARELAQDPPDLLQMLQVLNFSHWHSVLLDLAQRFDGWMADFLEHPASSPDFRPLAEMLAVLSQFPAAQAGDDLALGRAIVQCDFLVRAARDHCYGGLMWDPLVEPYAKFRRRNPDRFPYWDVNPAWPHEAMANWLAERALREKR